MVRYECGIEGKLYCSMRDGMITENVRMWILHRW